MYATQLVGGVPPGGQHRGFGDDPGGQAPPPALKAAAVSGIGPPGS